MDAEFGAEHVEETKKILERHFGKYPGNLRDYFNLLDALIAEMYHHREVGIERFTRQECYILANNFFGPDETPSKVYLARMLYPTLQIFENIMDNYKNRRQHHLKYLFMNVHDTNVSNFLRFLGYWDAFGYEKYTRFSSSVRLELIRRVDKNKVHQWYVRFIYDDEVLKLPWCNNDGYLCPFDDFQRYYRDNLITDYEYLDQFCNAKVGTDYT